MTRTSLEQLQGFLRSHQQHFFDKMRIADYGGTDNIQPDVVRNMLAGGNLLNYHMLDFDNGVDLRKPIKGKKYDLGICMDLLEHTSNPWLVAQNIQKSLNKGSFLFVTAPFVWEMHGYPEDYYRFTPSGIVELFKPMECEIAYVVADTHKDKGVKKIKPKVPPVPVGRPWSRVVAIFRK